MNKVFLNNLDEYIIAKRYRLINSVLVYENNELVFERYYNKFDEHSRNQIKSVWKSILSLTLGICLDMDLIKSIDEPICNYLPQFNCNISPYHRLISIRHLLTMSSGIYWNSGIHYHCPMFEQLRRSRNWLEHIADIQISDLPGTKFVYKEWDIILLSAVIGKAIGGTSWDICNEKLYSLLGIASDKWTISKCGIAYPSYGEDATSDLSAKDMAKIGLLMMQDGKWNDMQIVSNKYIKAAVTPSAVNVGYGLLWWLSTNACHASGFGGQEINIHFDKKLVSVIQATATPSSKSYGDISNQIIE